MNKKEATQNINDFIKYNAVDIAELYKNEPELGLAFENVLNALSKEYGSGEDISLSELVKKEEIIIEKPQTREELKLGDKVYIPKTKHGNAGNVRNSVIITKAVGVGQDYLYITNIDRITLNTELLEKRGDFFDLSDLEPYPGNLKVGDKLVMVHSKSEFTIEKIEDNKTRAILKDSLGYQTSVDLFLLNKQILKGDVLVNKSKVEEKPIEKPKEVLYELQVQTIPEKLKINYKFDSNKGDRKSPTQSAGELYRLYANNSEAIDELLSTQFEGNDGSYYKLVESKNTFVWKKVPAKTKKIDYTKLSLDELNKLANDIIEAQKLFSTDEPEYLTLVDNLIEIKEVIKTKTN